jgi:membrane-associated phospholipid phosphatase
MADVNLAVPRESCDQGWRVAGASPDVARATALRRDTAVKWGIIVAMIVADVLLCRARGLEFPIGNILVPLLIMLALGLPAVYYHRRREQSFVLCLTTLMLTIAFLPPFTVLMYATATSGQPLIDGALADFDRWCGVSVPEIHDWTNARPALRLVLDLAYGTLLIQLPLIVIILGLTGDRRRLETFVLQDMLAALVTLALFAAFPAAGPFEHYGFQPSPGQSRYLAHLYTVRAGERHVVNLHDAEGLVTCPSFHTTEALLMALAFRGRRVLFAVFATLNLLVAASTMTTGWHYFADVLAGLAVGLVVVAVVRKVRPWLEPAPVNETS